MRENDGRKLDHATLEALPIRAVQAIEAGEHPEDVARALGMARGTVFMWLAKYREGGLAALKAKPVPGMPPKLNATQLRRLYRLIAGSDPRQMSFEFALWTRELLRELIRRKFDVRLSAVGVGWLLKKLGLSPQRPLWRAWQADPDAVERWQCEEFPAIRAQARAEGATIYFGDEAGIRSDYHAGTTWAPVGQTPIVKATGARHSVNMISAVTAQGLLRFSVFTGSCTAAVFIDFCKKLLADTAGPVYLIVDGHPHPQGQAHQGVHRLHQRPAQAVRPARLLPTAQPGRVGLEERQARPDRPLVGHQRRGPQEQGHRRPAPPTEAAHSGPGLLRRPQPALHHRMIAVN